MKTPLLALAALSAATLCALAAPQHTQAQSLTLRAGFPVASSGTIQQKAGTSNGEFDVEDNSGFGVDVLLLVPITGGFSAGAFVQNTFGRSITSSSDGFPSTFDMGTTSTLDAYISYFIWGNDGFGVSLDAFGGATILLPSDDLESYQKQIGDEGTKIGYNFGAGPEFSIHLGRVTVLLNAYFMHEDITLGDKNSFSLDLSMTRYFLAAGLAF